MSPGELIERDAELAWLDPLVTDARRGRGALVLLTGEAGVGKTRFAEAATDAGGPLRGHLALLVPELGTPIAESDRPTLFEAVHAGLAAVAGNAPAVVLLDDLQWSDDATLELLAAVAAPLRELRLLVIAAYRSDEVPRAHQLRRLRNDLRRTRQLRELVVEPLSEPGTGALAERVLGAPAS